MVDSQTTIILWYSSLLRRAAELPRPAVPMTETVNTRPIGKRVLGGSDGEL
jgi:hypothetical protein